MKSTRAAVSRSRRELAVVLAVTVGVLLIFVGKAFTIDDTLFLRLAQHLRQDPVHFYAFDINWYGVVMPMWRITKNPPLTGYVLAAVTALGGFSEVFLHSVFLLAAGTAAAGTLALARRLCAHPVEATLLGILTPVFLVSSTNVMCDTMMVAIWVWAIWWWMRDVEGETNKGRVVAAGLVALAGLTKYFGFALIPLLLAVDLIRHRRLSSRVAWLLIPLGVATLYQLGTEASYGRGLLLDAADYSAKLRDYEQQSRAPWIAQSVTGLIFLGGCLLPTLFLAPALWARRWWLGGAAVVIGATLWSSLSGWLPGWDVTAASLSPQWSLYPQAWLMAAGGASMLALALADWWRRRDTDSALLVLWVLGTYVFAAHLNWVNNGRSNLPLSPVLGILIVRRLELLDRSALLSQWRFRTAAGFAAMLALAVAWGDFAHANRVRATVDIVANNHIRSAPRMHFQGHWGFQYYMEEIGARPLDLSRDSIYAGELVVITSNNTDTYALPEEAVQLLERIERPRTWVHTMAGDLGAGFYASGVGPIPFVFGTGPAAWTEVYSATQGFTGQLEKQTMPWW